MPAVRVAPKDQAKAQPEANLTSPSPVAVEPNGGILFRACEPVSVFLNEPQETLGTLLRIGRAFIDRDITNETAHLHRRHAKHGGGGPGRISSGVPDAILRIEHISGAERFPVVAPEGVWISGHKVEGLTIRSSLGHRPLRHDLSASESLPVIKDRRTP
jgi:hypothetical protein